MRAHRPEKIGYGRAGIITITKVIGRNVETVNIEEVKKFWESTPLFTGESKFTPGTKDFFEEHSATVVQDCFAGKLDESIFPDTKNKENVLDLGCGPGFWLIELARRGVKNLTGADLTKAAIDLANKRCDIFGIHAVLAQENAENLSFADNSFTHVNCQGVIHHSPDTAKCIQEIARVLQSGGTASISVYYKNIFLRFWPLFKIPAKLLANLGASLKGRGRDKIFLLENMEDIVRMYDGEQNPIGKAYTKDEIVTLVSPYFHVEKIFFHFFPARALPFKIPQFIHGFFDQYFGFMIYLNLKKKKIS